MSSVEIKERLHDLIERSDDRRLEAICVLLEIPSQSENSFDSETLEELYKSREAHLNSETKSYTIEESFQLARNSRK